MRRCRRYIAFAAWLIGLLAIQSGCTSTGRGKLGVCDTAPFYSRASLLGYDSAAGEVRARPLRPEEPCREEFENYTAVRGDSYWSIARKFNVPLDDLLRANCASKSSVLQIGQTVQIPVCHGQCSAATYVVRRGDSLSSIARASCCSVGELRQMNCLSGDLLMVGQRISVPASGKCDVRSASAAPSGVGRAASRAPSSPPQPVKFGDGSAAMHIVSRGETLSAIAASCGVTLRDLMELNSISDPNRIVEGQRILLSAGSQRRQPEQKATPQPPLRTPSSTPTRSQFDIDLLNLFDNDELFVGNN